MMMTDFFFLTKGIKEINQNLNEMEHRMEGVEQTINRITIVSLISRFICNRKKKQSNQGVMASKGVICYIGYGKTTDRNTIHQHDVVACEFFLSH